MSLGSIVVRLSMNTADFDTDTKRASAIAKKRAAEIDKAFTAAGAAIGAGLAVAAAAGAAALGRAIENADQLGEASARLGLSTEQFTAFAFAAKFSGIEADKFEASIRGFNSRIEQTEPLIKALGVSTRDLATGAFRPSTDIVRDLGDVFKELPSGIEESQLAADLFGTRLGSQMIPLLNLGTEGIKDMETEAEKLGGVLSTEAAAAAGEFNDELDKVQIAVNGALVKLIPQATETLKDFSSVITDPNFVAGLGAFVGFLGDIAQGFGLIISMSAKAANSVRRFSAEQSDEQLDTRLAALNTSINAARQGAGGQLPDNFEITMPNVARDIAERQRIIREQARRNREFQESQTGATASITPTVDPLEALRAAQEAARRKAKEEADSEASARRAAAEATREQAAASRALADEEEEAARRVAEAKQKQADAVSDLAEKVMEEDVARKEALGAGADLVKDLEFELALLKMTNEERAVAIQLRGLDAEAVAKYGDAIRDLNAKIEEEIELNQAADELRRGFEGTFASIIDGSKSAKDAFEDLGNFITQLVAQRLAAQLTESLFGGAGGPLGGSIGGGGFGAFLGSLFGGGRAGGGIVSPGKIYEVTENGPEMLRVGSRQFLLPTAEGGMVTPGTGSGGGGTVNQSITVVGRVDSRTASQLAAESGRAQRRVAARFGA